MIWEDEQMLDLVEQEYPEFLNLYKSILDPVERVDIWRYLVVHAKGGLYA